MSIIVFSLILNFLCLKIRQTQPRQATVSCSANEVCCDLASKDVSDIQIQSSASTQARTNVRCGISRKDSIIGRQKVKNLNKGETSFGEFPWQAAILKKDGHDNVYICSGSLIDASHILTAAHCVDGYKSEELVVRLGEWNVNVDNEFYSYLEVDVVGIATHEDFYPGNLANDIAVVRMLYPIDFSKNPHIGPICLPPSTQNFVGQRCWVTGWGTNTFGQKGQYQTLLKKVDVPIVSRDICETNLKATRLGASYKLHSGMMCAGGEPLKDACKGDGGGPLSCQSSSGNFVLTGIVSWGIGCGQPEVPGVYANVQYYLDWIHRILSS